MVIVTGCERSGTTAMAKMIANRRGLPYIHERYGRGVMKHSLNLNQNIKHLELLDHLYPNAEWIWVERNKYDTIYSLWTKIWQRYPHTMSLDDAILQYKQVNASCGKFKDYIIKDYDVIFGRKKHKFTKEQIDYIDDYYNSRN